MSYEFIEGIIKAGFDAVFVDVAGYNYEEDVVNFYKNQLGLSCISSEDKRFYVFLLDDYEK
jgi:hypothetical protein